MAIEIRRLDETNPPQLEAEIRAVRGLPRLRLTVYIIEPQGVLVYIDNELTRGQLDEINRVVEGHVPDWQERDRQDEVEILRAAFEHALEDWRGADKDLVLRQVVRYLTIKE